MAIAHIRTLACVAIVLVTVLGRVVDEGSRLPIVGVRVHAEGPTKATATTDRLGNFTINNLKPGSYVLTTEASNVPAQVFLVNVAANKPPQFHAFRVCSDDDEHCGPPGFGGGHP